MPCLSSVCVRGARETKTKMYNIRDIHVKEAHVIKKTERPRRGVVIAAVLQGRKCS